jgi:hypothetical protein
VCYWIYSFYSLSDKDTLPKLGSSPFSTGVRRHSLALLPLLAGAQTSIIFGKCHTVKPIPIKIQGQQTSPPAIPEGTLHEKKVERALIFRQMDVMIMLEAIQ